jgi:hypothetical protein
MLCKDESSKKLEGMDPVRRLDRKERYVNFTRLLSSEAMEPMRELAARFNITKEVRAAKAEGINPVRRFDARLRTLN